MFAQQATIVQLVLQVQLLVKLEPITPTLRNQTQPQIAFNVQLGNIAIKLVLLRYLVLAQQDFIARLEL